MRVPKSARVCACACLAALAAALGACGDETHASSAPAVTVTTTANLEDVRPAESVPMTIEARNLNLVDPTATPPPDQAAVASHFEIHLDDEAGAPLLVTAATDVVVPIPRETPAGPHQIIGRVHKHDGTPTEVTFDLHITVEDASAAADPPAAQQGGSGGATSTAVF
jgi:hypothetical protein